MLVQRPGYLALILALAACACSNDHRKPRQGDDDAAGAPSGGGGHPASSGSGSSPEGGSGSPGGDSGQGLVDGCADLDTDGVADCAVTLVETPSFTDGIEPWLAGDGDTSLSWDEKNALGDLPSGSAKLSATAPQASAFQCVPLSGTKLVVAYANAFVEASDGDEDDAPSQALLAVSYFHTSDCSDIRDGFFETPPTAVVGSWTTVQAGGVSGPTTASVSIALAGMKATAATDVTVYFDNVMLRAEELADE